MKDIFGCAVLQLRLEKAPVCEVADYSRDLYEKLQNVHSIFSARVVNTAYLLGVGRYHQDENLLSIHLQNLCVAFRNCTSRAFHNYFIFCYCWRIRIQIRLNQNECRCWVLQSSSVNSPRRSIATTRH